VADIRRVGAEFEVVVVPTEYVRGQFAHLLPAADLAKVVVVYHGTDAVVFPSRETPWTPDGPWLHVSRCAVPNALHKNFFWSCELVVAAARADMAAELHLCGGGNAAGLVTEYARQNGMADRITVVGELRQRELAARLRTAPFLLVPSMMEAASLVLVEAVLSGCVPVVLDYAGAAEVMRRLGLADLLVPARPRRVRVSGGDAFVEFVEPDKAVALDVLRWCAEDPVRTGALLAGAARVARESFAVGPAVRDLNRALTRRGIRPLSQEVKETG
jgi:glycosyltransferase involved in cell wall biosynthesis